MILNLFPLVNTYLTFRFQLKCHLFREAFSDLPEEVSLIFMCAVKNLVLP